MTAQARIAPESLGDGELARLCALRDPDALRHVITANNQRLFRAAWSILKDRAEAIGGTIRLESRQGVGTNLVAELPLDLRTP